MHFFRFTYAATYCLVHRSYFYHDLFNVQEYLDEYVGTETRRKILYQVSNNIIAIKHKGVLLHRSEHLKNQAETDLWFSENQSMRFPCAFQNFCDITRFCNPQNASWKLLFWLNFTFFLWNIFTFLLHWCRL